MADIAQLANDAKQQLDEHTRETVQWHFSEETGSPFWLEKAKTYDFNPLTDVNCFDDLKKFPLFEGRLAPRGADSALGPQGSG